VICKRIVTLLALVVAVAVAAPAGLAAEKPGKGSRQAQLKSLAEKAQESCRKAKDQAGNGKAHRKQCAKALRELLAALKAAERSIQRMQSRLEQVVAEKCGESASGETADRCAKARQRLERLESAEAKVHALIEKIERLVSKARQNGTSSASVSDEEIESVEELQEELEAAGK
jgi:chromosome segregation ATPase